MHKVVHILSALLLSFESYTMVTQNEPHTYSYGPAIEQVGQIPKEIYRNVVTLLPFVCVDVFLYNSKTKKYFLVWRDKKPAKDMWWFPGGRLYKGESFLQCAERKCQEEIGCQVKAIAPVDFASTIFPDSEWNTPTHSINIVVLAVYNETEGTRPRLDNLHSNYKWQEIAVPPADPYLRSGYDKAVELLLRLKQS